MAAALTSGDACKVCRFFRQPKPLPEDKGEAVRLTANDARGVYTQGECFRYPATVRKSPADVCGEFNREL